MKKNKNIKLLKFAPVSLQCPYEQSRKQSRKSAVVPLLVAELEMIREIKLRNNCKGRHTSSSDSSATPEFEVLQGHA